MAETILVIIGKSFCALEISWGTVDRDGRGVSEFHSNALFDQPNRVIGYIDPDPASVQSLRCFDSSSASAKWVQYDLTLI